jgi:hypothetical protein
MKDSSIGLLIASDRHFKRHFSPNGVLDANGTPQQGKVDIRQFAICA